ncbi:HAD family hydrolase [Winogradskyella sp.]|uniref:HAD family hydrolase n=1 Tax=Winogradskyella sp. TaxID=1883156 RepID=UPI003AB43E8B
MSRAQIKTIFWDFDGVLMNSNAIRDRGFLEVLKNYPKVEVNQLMSFHRINGGLSRYVKFRYFFEEIRGEKISDAEIQGWANKFSEIMLSLLVNKDLLIPETNRFVANNFQNYNMHIVSGSDGKELNKICFGVGISKYFNSIQGSPTPKNILVKDIINKEKYNKDECVLIGDSINDYEAANSNNIYFLGYNNELIEQKSNVNLHFS